MKTFLNIILAVVAICCFLNCILSKGLCFFLGLVPLYASVVGLVKLNTTWIEKY